MSNLLKMARARDDQEFVLRVSAALSVQAQVEETKPAQSEASKRLTTWVLENPMVLVDRIMAYVAVNAGISQKFKIVNGAIDTSEVLDEDILAVVAARWEQLANYLVAKGLI